MSKTNGNGALTYPVGLLTFDEVIYADGESTDDCSHYLCSSIVWATMSPLILMVPFLI